MCARLGVQIMSTATMEGTCGCPSMEERTGDLKNFGIRRSVDAAVPHRELETLIARGSVERGSGKCEVCGGTRKVTTSYLEKMVGTVLCVWLNRSGSVQNVVVPSSILKFSGKDVFLKSCIVHLGVDQGGHSVCFLRIGSYTMTTCARCETRCQTSRRPMVSCFFTRGRLTMKTACRPIRCQ